MPNDPRTTVLVIDDDPTFVSGLGSALQTCGYRVLEALDAKQAYTFLDEGRRVDLIVVDLNLPDKSGLEIIHETARRQDGKKILATTGTLSPLHLEIAGYMGAHVAVPKFQHVPGKPFPAREWVTTIRRTFEEQSSSSNASN